MLQFGLFGGENAAYEILRTLTAVSFLTTASCRRDHHKRQLIYMLFMSKEDQNLLQNVGQIVGGLGTCVPCNGSCSLRHPTRPLNIKGSLFVWLIVIPSASIELVAGQVTEWVKNFGDTCMMNLQFRFLCAYLT